MIPHRRHAYGFPHAAKLLLLCFCIAVQDVFAQDTLSNVEIVTTKRNLSQIGKKTERIDSTVKEQFKFASVGDVLSFNTPVFIKSYGPGALSTTAFRGGNAAQTAVLWNGFNLQNSMLGQADLALMPALLFEDIGIEYGGSSSLWGSGAVGGSIHLDNKAPFGKGLFSSTQLGAGDIGLRSAATSFLVSKQRLVSSTKLYFTDNQNTYKYKDTTDAAQPVKRQQNAAYNFLGLMQELKYMINARQIVTVNAWLNRNQRHLPNAGQAESKSYQEDAAIRLNGSWSYLRTNFRSAVRAAFFSDYIHYTDSLASVFSKSRANTLIAENENYFNWHKRNQLNMGVNVTSSTANTENYSSAKTLSRVSLLVGNKFSFLNEKLLAYAALRAEYFSVGALPVTGNVSLEYRLLKPLSLMANAAKVYRQPTLNDLYWIPGGNPNLKAEQGYTFEGSVNYKKQLKTVSVEISGAAFSRKLNNWILWLPGVNGNPSPVNVQQVWSRGTETTWKLNYKRKHWRAGIGLVTGYVLSTVAADKQENSNAVNKQLIYTPRYTVNGNASAGYKDLYLFFFHQYVGYRFITSDNSEWLDPYHVSSLRLNYKIDLKKATLSFYAAVNNLFNTNYAVLAARPMPLRNVELGITLQTRSKTTNNQ